MDNPRTERHAALRLSDAVQWIIVAILDLSVANVFHVESDRPREIR